MHCYLKLQGDPTAAMRFLQQFATQQAQQGGLAANAAAPLPSLLQPAQHGSAALPTLTPPQGAHPEEPHLQQQQQEQQLPHAERPAPGGEPMPEPHAALAAAMQPLAGSQESTAGAAGPLLQPALRPALPASGLAEDKQLAASALGAAAVDMAWHEARQDLQQQQQHQHSPAFTFQPAKHGSELLTNSPAALAVAQLPAGVQQLPLQLHPQQAEASQQGAAASPAAVSDMDLALDSQDSPSGLDVPLAQQPLTWLQLNAVGGSGAQQHQQQYPAEAAIAALEHAVQTEEARGPHLEEDAAMQEVDVPDEEEDGGRMSTRKRTRNDGGGGRQRSQRAQQAQHAPPLSPRSMSAKRKPLRTITSALE